MENVVEICLFWCKNFEVHKAIFVRSIFHELFEDLDINCLVIEMLEVLGVFSK